MRRGGAGGVHVVEVLAVGDVVDVHRERIDVDDVLRELVVPAEAVISSERRAASGDVRCHPERERGTWLGGARGSYIAPRPRRSLAHARDDSGLLLLVR